MWIPSVAFSAPRTDVWMFFCLHGVFFSLLTFLHGVSCLLSFSSTASFVFPPHPHTPIWVRDPSIMARHLNPPRHFLSLSLSPTLHFFFHIADFTCSLRAGHRSLSPPPYQIFPFGAEIFIEGLGSGCWRRGRRRRSRRGRRGRRSTMMVFFYPVPLLKIRWGEGVVGKIGDMMYS